MRSYSAELKVKVQIELHSLFYPSNSEEFNKNNFLKTPYSRANNAKKLLVGFNWQIILDILDSGYNDCWLPQDGHLPIEEALNSGCLSREQAYYGLGKNRTLLIRHSEKAHSYFKTLAQQFQKLYQKPIDVQVYITPPGQEGFGWHYDMEEVFVLQCVGSKEFYMFQNQLDPLPQKTIKTRTNNASKYFKGPEIRCYLEPGDWLYIPSGYWHKAKANTFSCHFSVGILCK